MVKAFIYNTMKMEKKYYQRKKKLPNNKGKYYIGNGETKGSGKYTNISKSVRNEWIAFKC